MFKYLKKKNIVYVQILDRISHPIVKSLCERPWVARGRPGPSLWVAALHINRAGGRISQGHAVNWSPLQEAWRYTGMVTAGLPTLGLQLRKWTCQNCLLWTLASPEHRAQTPWPTGAHLLLSGAINPWTLHATGISLTESSGSQIH